MVAQRPLLFSLDLCERSPTLSTCQLNQYLLCWWHCALLTGILKRVDFSNANSFGQLIRIGSQFGAFASYVVVHSIPLQRNQSINQSINQIRRHLPWNLSIRHSVSHHLTVFLRVDYHYICTKKTVWGYWPACGWYENENSWSRNFRNELYYIEQCHFITSDSYH